MMNWQQFWNKQFEFAGQQNEGLQVGRVVNGAAMSKELLQRIGSHISAQLQLKNTDHLLDVCCGNGLLSSLLAKEVKSVVGVDFSESLIESAQQYTNESIQFVRGDATYFSIGSRFDKVLLYFSFQYFESYGQGKAVISNLLKHAKPGAILLIGDIPDSSRFFTYYDSTAKWVQYFKSLVLGNNNMGKFWSEKELLSICKELGVKGEIIKQEGWQPYAHYRFDLILYA